MLLHRTSDVLGRAGRVVLKPAERPSWLLGAEVYALIWASLSVISHEWSLGIVSICLGIAVDGWRRALERLTKLITEQGQHADRLFHRMLASEDED